MGPDELFPVLRVMANATGWPFRHRNHYCAGPGHAGWGTLVGAAARGWMCQRSDGVWCVTDAGISVLEELWRTLGGPRACHNAWSAGVDAGYSGAQEDADPDSLEYPEQLGESL